MSIITYNKFLDLFIFSIVGTLGFIVDAGILYALKDSIGLYFAKLFSFFCAVIVTWLLNRFLTFKRRPSGMTLSSEFARYFSLMIFGGIINYLSFWISTSLSTIIYDYPIIGVAIGSFAGLIFNYISTKKFIFKNSIF